MYIAPPGAYLLHAPRAVCISNMILDGAYLTYNIRPDYECGSGAYGPGTACLGPQVEGKISKKRSG